MLPTTVTVAAPYGFPLFTLLMAGLVVYEWLLLLSLSRTTSMVVAGVMMFVLWMVSASAVATSVFDGTTSVMTAEPPIPALSTTVTSAPS